MRLSRALCATLGALFIALTLPSATHAANTPTLSEAYVVTKDGQVVDTLTVTDPSRTMSESICNPYVGNSTDHHVEFVTRDDASVCHMQLMYSRLQDDPEFAVQDSGEFVLTARTDQTLSEYRKIFGSSLSLASVFLSVEGEVKSSTSGASTSATIYEGRSLSVSTWTTPVPQVITVNGSLNAGGNLSTGGGANGLKNPWGVTPIPGNGASPEAAAAASSSDPSIGLLIALIVSLIVLVLVAVIIFYVLRARKSEESSRGAKRPTHPSHVRRPSASRINEAGGPRASTAPVAFAPPSRPSAAAVPPPVQARRESVDPDSSRRPTPPIPPPAPAPAPAPAPKPMPAPATPPASEPKRVPVSKRVPAPESVPAPEPTQASTSAPPQSTPSDTSFARGDKSRPAHAAQTSADASARVPMTPKRRHSRSGHRPAVFPERPAQPLPQPPSSAGSTQEPSVPDAASPQRGANTPVAPIPAAPPSIEGSQGSRRSASVWDRETHVASERAPIEDSSAASFAQPGKQVQARAVPQPEANAPARAEEAPAHFAPPVPPPPASLDEAAENPDEATDTLLLPRIQRAVIPMPAAESVAVPEPEPILAPPPAPVAPTPDPEPVFAPEPEPAIAPPYTPDPTPEPEPVFAPEPESAATPPYTPDATPEPVVAPPLAPIAPEPEPEPAAAAPYTPDATPEPEPAPASLMPVDDEAELPTARLPRIRSTSSFDWSTPASATPAPEPPRREHAFVDTPPLAPPPARESTSAPQSSAPPLPSQPGPMATPQAPAAPQAPAVPPSVQEDWNAEFSWNEEARQEQEGESKRRKRWGWGRRRKQREEPAPATPEVDEQTPSDRVPIIAIDAQDDDWNDWQNWNSRS